MRAVDSMDRDDSPFARWILPALILSLILHAGLLYWARTLPLNSSEQAVYEKIVPRTFHLERVEIDPKLLQPENAEKKQAAMAPQAVNLPEEKVAFEELMGDKKGAPAMPKLDQTILSEKPTAASTSLEQTLATAQKNGAQSVLEDPKALQQALLEEKPGAAAVGDLLKPDTMTGRAIVKSGEAAGGDKPGFSNLDDLLAQTGPLTSETAPILMPTDLLFDYDQAQLKPEALASLEKLGALIQRNPQAVFQIEGHSDSFGSDEYNMSLSQRRADLVKDWLITAMSIPAEKVSAQGYGKTRLIAPATGSIEEQAINRRVEIVIRTAQ